MKVEGGKEGRKKGRRVEGEGGRVSETEIIVRSNKKTVNQSLKFQRPYPFRPARFLPGSNDKIKACGS